MAIDTSNGPATVRGPIFDQERLAWAMEARDMDGVVITTALNTTYLSGHNPTAPKADEPPGVAVVISRHDLQHPILIGPDIFLSPFLDDPIWIEDLRPHRSVLISVNAATEASEFFKFMPASRQDSGWVKSAGERFAGSLTEGIRGAMQDLGLSNGKVGYDDLRLGAKVAGSLADVIDAYSMMMFVREVKSAQEIEWLRESTRVNQVAIERTVQSWSRGKTWKELVDTYHRGNYRAGRMGFRSGRSVLREPSGRRPRRAPARRRGGLRGAAGHQHHVRLPREQEPVLLGWRQDLGGGGAQFGHVQSHRAGHRRGDERDSRVHAPRGQDR